MVNPGSSSSYRLIRSRIVPSRSIPLYVLLLLAFSVVVFLFSRTQIAVVDRNALLPGGSSTELEEKLWGSSSGYGYRPCVRPTRKYAAPAPQQWNRYLTVRSNGDLNQMRTGICDMVAVAHLMNATLVIPQLDRRFFWQDTSTFSDIFDELHLIKALEGDVHVIRELPKEMESAPRACKHFMSWSGVSYYEEISQLWKDYQVIHVPKSDSRLANNDLPIDIQRLWCRAMYHALHFSSPIENLGKGLNLHDADTTEASGAAQITIALHLRYEKDMLSFTGCAHGLNDMEAEVLIMRENTNHWKIKDINSTEQRLAGEIYGGETYLSNLRSRFPNLVFKENLATMEEMKDFASHASQTATIDYIISVESDAFVSTYTGNMARDVEGHRRFLGHRKTISSDRGEMKQGPKLSSLVFELHKYRQGAPRKRYGSLPGHKGQDRLRTFYENPFPECICLADKH